MLGVVGRLEEAGLWKLEVGASIRESLANFKF